jgi:hypothetical protein
MIEGHEKRDFFESGRGFGDTTGQTLLLAETAGGLKVTAAPAPALATSTGGRMMGVGGSLALETTPQALGAGLTLMSENVVKTQENSSSEGTTKPVDNSVDVPGSSVPAEANLHEQALAARDALVAQSLQKRHPPATVVGAYSPSTGQATAGASRGGGAGCAEAVCSEALGNPPDIQFTQAVRPRTGKNVPVCTTCESTYGRDAFPDPETQFESGTGGGG